MKYGRSKVPLSAAFKEIMDNYQRFGRAMPINTFYEEYVKRLDSSITKRKWSYFIKKVNDSIIEKSSQAITALENIAVNENLLEEKSLKKVLAISDFTLDEIVNNPEMLARIPIKERMNWLFKAMKARDSRMTVALKKRTDDRKQNVFESLMEGAQYGAIDVDEVERQEALPQPEKVLPTKTVEFSPESL